MDSFRLSPTIGPIIQDLFQHLGHASTEEAEPILYRLQQPQRKRRAPCLRLQLADRAGHHTPLASGRGSPPPRLLRLGPSGSPPAHSASAPRLLPCLRPCFRARAGCRTSSTSLLYLWVATCTSTSPPPPLPSTSSAAGRAGCETRWPGGRRPPPRRAPVRRWSVGESDAYLRSERRATQNGWCLWAICWRVYLVGKTLCKTYFWVWVTLCISCWRQP